MVKLDAAAAADMIEDHVDHDHAEKNPPGGHHSLAYITDVTQHLEMEPNSANLAYVAQLLTIHGIEQPEMIDYPKWVHVKAAPEDYTKLLAATGSNRVNMLPDGVAAVLFDDEDEEKEFFTDTDGKWAAIEYAKPVDPTVHTENPDEAAPAVETKREDTWVTPVNADETEPYQETVPNSDPTDVTSTTDYENGDSDNDFDPPDADHPDQPRRRKSKKAK